MAETMDDLNLDELEKDITSKNAVEDRIRTLHAGKKEAEDARTQAETKAKEAEDKLKVMEKETQFLSSFADSVSKPDFQGATEYKDKIKEKFNSGYSLEDAIITTLHSEGKFTPSPVIERVENVGGGSASIQITNSNKTSGQMTQAERLEALKEAEKRGDLYMS